jgi:large conductance mechanosensitive channel
MKKFFEEFKKFAMRGNVIDLAVGMVMGSAFTAIVNSLVNDIISPLIGLFATGGFSQVVIPVGKASLGIGSFLMAVVNFLIVAFVLFCVVKTLNKASSLTKKKEQAPAPTTKKCPYCLSEIPIGATRCPHCTSQLDKTL